jgi:hypothetical protein
MDEPYDQDEPFADDIAPRGPVGDGYQIDHLQTSCFLLDHNPSNAHTVKRHAGLFVDRCRVPVDS